MLNTPNNEGGLHCRQINVGNAVNMSNTLKGSLLVLLSALCFSISGTLQAIAPDEATPFVITEARMLVGSLFLFIWCACS